MSEMVDQVAAKMLAHLNEHTDAVSERGYVVQIDGSVSLVHLARAAIAAMREPTDAMYDAGDEFVGFHGDSGNAEKVWHAMIDAALR